MGNAEQLIYMRYELVPDANIRHRTILRSDLGGEDLEELCGARGQGIDGGGLPVLTIHDQELVVPCHVVVSAIVRWSRISAVDARRDGAPFASIAGDALPPVNIILAIYETYHAALDIKATPVRVPRDSPCVRL